MKIQSNIQGKKQPTNPSKKEQHLLRKAKRSILRALEDSEQQQAILEFKKNADKSL